MRCGFGGRMRRSLIVVAVLIGFSSAQVFAAEEESNKPPEVAQESDEYDFSWLDPDKKIYVVQNRKYTKARRFEAVLGGGLGVGEPYRSRTAFIPRGIFYFSEHWGIEGIAGFMSNAENDDFLGLKSVSSTVPTVRDVQQFTGGSLVWLPFYGKLNTFNRLFYFDWYFSFGINQLKSEIDLNTSNTGAARILEDTYTGIHWGTGMKFFVNRNFGVRLDYLALYYKAPSMITGAVDGIEDTYDNHFLTVGLSYTF